MLFQDT